MAGGSDDLSKFTHNMYESRITEIETQIDNFKEDINT